MRGDSTGNPNKRPNSRHDISMRNCVTQLLHRVLRTTGACRPFNSLTPRIIFYSLALSTRIAAPQCEIEVAQRVELAKGGRLGACTMHGTFVTTTQVRVPCDQIKVVHGEVAVQLARMEARVEAPTCNAVVDIGPTRRDAVVAHFDPWRVPALKHVDAHEQSRLKTKKKRAVACRVRPLNGSRHAEAFSETPCVAAVYVLLTSIMRFSAGMKMSTSHIAKSACCRKVLYLRPWPAHSVFKSHLLDGTISL